MNLTLQEKNEESVNKILYRIFQAMTVCLLLSNIVQILLYGMPKLHVMNVLYHLTFLLFLVPVIYYKTVQDQRLFKKISVLSTLLFAFILHTDSWVNVPFVWLVPIGLASLYADYKLIKKVFLISIPLLILAQFTHYFFAQKLVIETSMYRSILTSFYYGAQFIFVGILFTNSTKRSRTMLESSENLTEEIQSVLHTVENASSHLNKNVHYLNQNIGDSTGALVQIDQSVQGIHTESRKFTGIIDDTESSIQNMINRLENTSEQATHLKKQTVQISEFAKENKTTLEKAVKDIEHVKEASLQSKETVQNLENKIDEISDVLSSITTIASQTNLLALNAAIEAARAGQQGKGFAVVADEVRRLADQSTQSANVIQELLEGIMSEKEKVAQSLQQTDDIILSNVHSIRASVKGYDELALLQQGIYTKLQTITDDVDLLSNEGSVLSSVMLDLKQKHLSNDLNISEIVSSLEEASAAFQEITGNVEEVNAKSQKLYELHSKKE